MQVRMRVFVQLRCIETTCFIFIRLGRQCRPQKRLLVRCVTAKQKGLVRDAERKCLLIELLVGRCVHDFLKSN